MWSVRRIHRWRIKCILTKHPRNKALQTSKTTGWNSWIIVRNLSFSGKEVIYIYRDTRSMHLSTVTLSSSCDLTKAEVIVTLRSQRPSTSISHSSWFIVCEKCKIMVCVQKLLFVIVTPDLVMGNKVFMVITHTHTHAYMYFYLSEDINWYNAFLSPSPQCQL